MKYNHVTRKEDGEQGKVRIDSVIVKTMEDDCPDTSYIGEYTNDIKEGVIIRKFGEFYEKLTDEQLDNLENRGREYRGFLPYAGGEKIGTNDYYKYGLQDFDLMEGLCRGDWCFIGIQAEATISYSIGQGNYRIERLTSSGLWGIESDSGEKYLNEIKQEQLNDLKNHLETFNVDVSDFDEKVQED